MKIDKLTLIKKCLNNEITTIQKAYDAAIAARDSAPTAMESHSDTTRNQSEKLASALKQQVSALKMQIASLPPNLNDNHTDINIWSYCVLSNNEDKLQLIVVPEGYGGKEIDGIKFISATTPLAKEIIGKANNVEVIMGDTKYLITECE